METKIDNQQVEEAARQVARATGLTNDQSTKVMQALSNPNIEPARAVANLGFSVSQDQVEKAVAEIEKLRSTNSLGVDAMSALSEGKITDSTRFDQAVGRGRAPQAAASPTAPGVQPSTTATTGTGVKAEIDKTRDAFASSVAPHLTRPDKLRKGVEDGGAYAHWSSTRQYDESTIYGKVKNRLMFSLEAATTEQEREAIFADLDLTETHEKNHGTYKESAAQFREMVERRVGLEQQKAPFADIEAAAQDVARREAATLQRLDTTIEADTRRREENANEFDPVAEAEKIILESAGTETTLAEQKAQQKAAEQLQGINR